MKSAQRMERCLGYFETASREEIYEICNFNVTNTELILEAFTV